MYFLPPNTTFIMQTIKKCELFCFFFSKEVAIYFVGTPNSSAMLDIYNFSPSSHEANIEEIAGPMKPKRPEFAK